MQLLKLVTGINCRVDPEILWHSFFVGGLIVLACIRIFQFLLIHFCCRYCHKIPDGYPLEKAAPLVCAGITVYTPMMRHNMNQPGKSLGVVGLGGLGHMAVKFGKAFGLKVTVFSTSESKRDEAISLLGADNFVISSDEKQMEV
jgi:D-arabinose 1-dehydrogenase-like Zn-dependent alcohol dehydrogenase